MQKCECDLGLHVSMSERARGGRSIPCRVVSSALERRRGGMVGWMDGLLSLLSQVVCEGNDCCWVNRRGHLLARLRDVKKTHELRIVQAVVHHGRGRRQLFHKSCVNNDKRDSAKLPQTPPEPRSKYASKTWSHLIRTQSRQGRSVLMPPLHA